jgi:hypothetical protein
MSTTILVNPENTLKALQAQMSLEMQAAAEPIIQAAIKDAEKAIRERVGRACISLIEQSMDVRMNESHLVITIKQGAAK